jgi:bifunctional polynucleotide phosphatase/kinase
MSNLLFINYYQNLIPETMYSLASFDLDYTLIKTKSGNVFPKNKDDWVIWDQKVREKLLELSKNPNFIIVIFSNQKGLEKKITINDFKEKINNIQKLLNINFIFIASLEDDIYRKPRIGMYNYLKETLNIKINKNNSFYVGDMAGRKNDKYDTDIKFALNLKIKFYTPEEFFLNDKTILEYKLSGYLLNNNSKNTKINIPPQMYQMVIISGYPGSGKSHLMNKFLNDPREPKYECFSRDNLGNKFHKKLEQAMEQGKPVVIEGLYSTNQARNELLNLADKYKYNKTYILVKTSYELSYHLNLYRNLYNKTSDYKRTIVPEIVYMKYRKSFEYPNESDWNQIVEYHPHISSQLNKFYLY